MRVEAADIRRTVSLLGLLPAGAKVLKSGQGKWRTACPLHGGEGPNLSIRYANDGWRFCCFVCHEQGDVIDYVMKIERVDFKAAMELLGQRDRIAPPVAYVEPSKKAFAIPCDGAGCGRVLNVDLADIPYLKADAPGWTFTGTYQRPSALCSQCGRRKDGRPFWSETVAASVGEQAA